jgi:hypothetical protein
MIARLLMGSEALLLVCPSELGALVAIFIEELSSLHLCNVLRFDARSTERARLIKK